VNGKTPVAKPSRVTRVGCGDRIAACQRFRHEGIEDQDRLRRRCRRRRTCRSRSWATTLRIESRIRARELSFRRPCRMAATRRTALAHLAEREG
jgi:hypothetical protein